MLKKTFISLLIIIAILIAYEPIRHNNFILYDDQHYITENPHITNGINVNTIIWAFTESHAANWHPLTWLSHTIDYEFFKLNPVPYHLINLLLHIIDSILVFWIFKKLTNSLWSGAFIAAVFALHPLQVESVAWAAERKTVLNGMFWFLTVALYLKYTPKPSVSKYILLVFTYLLCVLTKPVAVTLPFVLLLLDYWPLNRLSTKTISKLIIEKIPLFLLSALLSIITLISQEKGGSIITLQSASMPERVANMFVSYMRYIGKMIWPSKLAVFYPPLELDFPKILIFLSIAIFILILILCFHLRSKRRYFITGWLWYIGMLIPMIGIIQAGAQSMANRYMYISMLGLLIIFVMTIKDFAAKNVKLSAISASVVLIIFILLTRLQVKHWQNGITLFEYAIKTTKNNYLAENCYAISLFDAGRTDEAIAQLTQTVKKYPTYNDARNNLGQFLLKQGKIQPAIECFEELIKQKYDSDNVYYDLAIAYQSIGNYKQAINTWNKALLLKPDSSDILNNLAWLLSTADDNSVRNPDKAIKFAKQSCELTNYQNPAFLDTLAAAFASASKFDDARKTAQTAADIALKNNKYELANQIQTHLKLYKSNQPFIDKINSAK